ncbi:MAG: hypothetical protein AAF789_12310 [Bacteroidota bacterium]
MSRYVLDYENVTEDNSNKYVRGRRIKVHNQGTTVAWVNREILLPDDQLLIEAPGDGHFILRLQINFLAAYPFQNAIAIYPQLYSGNRINIVEMKKEGADV